MQLSEDGLALLKSLEGFRSRTYLDSAGKKTIGYGHLIVPGDGVAPGDILEEVQATGLLRRDVKIAENAVNDAVKVEINQNQFDALVIFTFNLGAHALRTSTLLRLLNSGDYEAAADQFPLWCKIRTSQGAFVEIAGLKNRRLAEQKLFETSLEGDNNA